MTAAEKLRLAIKALNIYDDCMGEMSFAFGHFRPRMAEAVADRLDAVCLEAMKAQRILHKLEQTK